MLREILNHKKYRVYIALVVITGILLFIAFNVVQAGPYILRGIGGIVFQFLDIVSPVFWAFILAYVLYYPMRYIEKWIYKLRGDREIKRKTKGRIRLLSVTVTFLLVIILLIGITNFIVPPLITSVNSLLSSILEFEANLDKWINELTEYMATPHIASQEGTEIVSDMGIILDKFGVIILSDRARENVKGFIRDLDHIVGNL